jgi:FtsP/CotA-like multicopper oxidase with cupredoxin domain
VLDAAIMKRGDVARFDLRSVPLAIPLLLLAACGADGATPGRGGDPSVELVTARDRDPDPDVVSVRLVAARTEQEVLPGRQTELFTYSNAFPGPLVRAKRGDRLIVELDNRLSEPTTLHFHGMRVPNAMDGVPGETQSAVLPGTTFTYDFVAPDAGVFWYHPHHESLAALGAGLFGAVLIDEPDEEPELGDEVVLVLSDLSLDAQGRREPDGVDTATMLAGNEGKVVLVNGRARPTLDATPGRRQRWRVLNAARSRYFELSLAHHSFLQIGGDGGRSEYPVEVRTPVVTPGERLDLLVEPRGAAGTFVELVALPISRGLPFPESDAVTLLDVRMIKGSGPPSPPLPALERAMTPIDASSASRIPIALTLHEGEDATSMGINGVPYVDGEPIHARVGDTQLLIVENQTPFDHPFHLHGFFFEEVDANGTAFHPLARKDTVNVRALETRRLLVHYDERPGMWMFHCHILDHAQAGMMGMVHLTP